MSPRNSPKFRSLCHSHKLQTCSRTLGPKSPYSRWSTPAFRISCFPLGCSCTVMCESGKMCKFAS